LRSCNADKTDALEMSAMPDATSFSSDDTTADDSISTMA